MLFSAKTDVAVSDTRSKNDEIMVNILFITKYLLFYRIIMVYFGIIVNIKFKI
ncbi:hypothetical protein D3C74_445120 [compost metagenome]